MMPIGARPLSRHPEIFEVRRKVAPRARAGKQINVTYSKCRGALKVLDSLCTALVVLISSCDVRQYPPNCRLERCLKLYKFTDSLTKKQGSSCFIL